MATTVRAALLQTDWTGDKESMIDKHEEAAREAAAEGAQVICFQELFYGPYFCQVQDAAVLRLHRGRSPTGPTTQRFQSRRQGARHGDGAADVRDRAGRRVLQHRGRDRRRRHVPRQVPQAAHPAGQGVLGEVLLPARQRRVPDLRHRRRQGRRVHLLRPPLPRGLAGRSASTAPRSCSTRRPPTAACRSTCGASSSRPPPWPTCTTSGRSTGSASSRSRRERLLRPELLRRPARASSSATSATRTSPS